MPIMALPATPLEEWSPHSYWPDYQAMGDCVMCGHTRENCERNNAAWAVCAAISAIGSIEDVGDGNG